MGPTKNLWSSFPPVTVLSSLVVFQVSVSHISLPGLPGPSLHPERPPASPPVLKPEISLCRQQHQLRANLVSCMSQGSLSCAARGPWSENYRCISHHPPSFSFIDRRANFSLLTSFWLKTEVLKKEFKAVVINILNGDKLPCLQKNEK